MVIIHQTRKAVPVTEMQPGQVFYNHSKELCMVTDDFDTVDECVTVLNLDKGILGIEYANTVAVPMRITMMEVDG